MDLDAAPIRPQFGESGLIPRNLAVTIIMPLLKERVGDEKT
jgi:hypothetical protein